MTEVGQGPLDPRIAPVSVFRGHAHDQRSDRRDDRRSSWPTTWAPVVLLRDQPTMPGQQGVRRDNRANVPQDAPSEYLGFRGQPSPLLVRELQSSGAEQFSHGAVLFLEVVDHVALLLVDPTRVAARRNWTTIARDK